MKSITVNEKNIHKIIKSGFKKMKKNTIDYPTQDIEEQVKSIHKDLLDNRNNMKTIDFYEEMYEVYIWTCPYAKCGYENQTSYVGEEVDCSKCGRTLKVKK